MSAQHAWLPPCAEPRRVRQVHARVPRTDLGSAEAQGTGSGSHASAVPPRGLRGVRALPATRGPAIRTPALVYLPVERHQVRRNLLRKMAINIREEFCVNCKGSLLRTNAGQRGGRVPRGVCVHPHGDRPGVLQSGRGVPHPGGEVWGAALRAPLVAVSVSVS